MNVNFVESNPIPVKAAMALMGLLEPVYRLPMVPPGPASLAKIEKVLESVGTARESARCRLRSNASSTTSRPPTPPSTSRLFARIPSRPQRRAASAPPSRTPTPTGWRVNAWVKKGILLGFRMGGIVDMSVDASASRSSTSTPTP